MQKKIKKTPPHPIPNKTPIAPTQEVKTFTKTTDTNVKPKITQLTQGKDNHPVLKEIQKAIQQAQFYPRQAKKCVCKELKSRIFMERKQNFSRFKNHRKLGI